VTAGNPRSASRRRFLRGSLAVAAAPALGGCGGPRKSADPGVPQSGFGADSTAAQVTRGVDLEGKTAVVTGCTSGLGYETMRVLARRGAYVIGTSRSLQRAKAVSREMPGITSGVALELGNLDSVAECAETLRSLNTPIDILVCNAGFRGGGNERQLVDGVERHFAVNHLGHFVLVNRLIDRLYYAWQGRIVVVASRTAYRDAPEQGILFDDLAMQRRYSDALAYGHSKLANVLFSLQLGKMLRGSRITSNSVHPGVINTDIDRDFGMFMRIGFGLVTALIGKTVEEGAATTCYVATSRVLGSTSGRYFEDCNAVRVEGADTYMHDAVMAEKLWVASAELAGDYAAQPEIVPWDEFENGLPRRRGDE